MKYNPLKAPDPKRWLNTDEMDRSSAVIAYHKRAGVELPSEQVHAFFHVVIENQAAMGDETPVAQKLLQLMKEGLDRHEAVHAIGGVLADQVWKLMRDNASSSTDPNDAYFKEVSGLTAQKWRDEYAETED
jgi:hypothetical protein